MGESSTLDESLNDEMFMPYINSCNISCNAHAGTKAMIERTVKQAKSHKLRIGAHPSYPDRTNFGRKSMNITWINLKNSLMEQISLLTEIAQRHETKISYIKPHGALYNDMCKDTELRNKVISFIRMAFPEYKIMLMAGLVPNDGSINYIINEGFLDRQYSSKNTLLPRSENGAVLHTEKKIKKQLDSIVKKNTIVDVFGNSHHIKVDSLCVHSDTPNALNIAKFAHQYVKSLHV